MSEFQAVEKELNVTINKAVDVQDKAMVPVYVWKTGKTFFLSKKEKIVADTFLATRNYRECARALIKEGFKKDWITCKRWLDKPHISEYLVEKFEELGIASGWTRDHWIKVINDHIQGKIRLANGDLYAMKLIANVKGWDEGTGAQIINTINFTQANGAA